MGRANSSAMCQGWGKGGEGALDCGHMAPAFKEGDGDGYKVLEAGCRQLVDSNRNWHSSAHVAAALCAWASTSSRHDTSTACKHTKGQILQLPD